MAHSVTDTTHSEYVLKRDGTNVVVNSACVPQSGTWRSPYDAETTTSASDLDIDHMVPLKNAWIVCSLVPLRDESIGNS